MCCAKSFLSHGYELVMDVLFLLLLGLGWIPLLYPLSSKPWPGNFLWPTTTMSQIDVSLLDRSTEGHYMIHQLPCCWFDNHENKYQDGVSSRPGPVGPCLLPAWPFWGWLIFLLSLWILLVETSSLPYPQFLFFFADLCCMVLRKSF